MKLTGGRFARLEDLVTDEIGDERLHRYYAAATLIRGMHVLDLACGKGYGSSILAKDAASVQGVDIDLESIQWARQKYRPAFSNLHFTEGSAETIPFADQSFDAVISFDTIERLDAPGQQDFMLEVKRVLRPGGLLLMSTQDKKNGDRYTSKNSFPQHQFYRAEYKAFISRYFDHTSFFEQGYEIVSIISDAAAEKPPSLTQFNRAGNDPDAPERKYMIAVGSDLPLDHRLGSFSSIVPKVDKDFYSVINHLTGLDDEVAGSGIPALDETADESLRKIKNLKAALVQANEKQKMEEVLQEQAKLQLDELQHIMNGLYQELNTTKERLAEIYSSDGWHLLSRYYRLKGRFLPENSAAYRWLKKIYQFVRFKKKSAAPPQQTAAESFLSSLPDGSIPLTIPSYPQPMVSIIIPAYNGWPVNHYCIYSIINHTVGVAYEVLLADDASTDLTADCPSIVENLVHVRSTENRGFLKNCNYAASFAKGKYLLFLNNDTRVESNWLSPLVTLLESDEQIAMAGSKLIYPDGKLQEAGGIIWNDASAWNYGHRQDPQLSEFNYVKEVDYLSGAAIAIRNTAWQEAGGFDEQYSPAYCEDADLAFTFRKLGYKVMFQPLSEVTHYEGFSHGTDATLKDNEGSIKSYQKINNRKFFEKWKEVLLKEHFPNGVNVFQARDRSAGRKTMLVIDHYVPHFDKDAGSKTTFQYLGLFISLGLNVKFIGDNFFREEPYTTALQQMGIEVLYGPACRDNWQQWIADNHSSIDYVLLNRPHISIKYIDFIKKATRAKILYYGHDLHFVREKIEYSVKNDPAILKSAEKWKETETYLFENVDIILTPSEDEKNIIHSISESFHTEAILPYFFKNPAVPVSSFHTRAGILFVGGFAHTPNLDAVNWFCEEVWPMVKAALPGTPFVVVGSNPPEAILALQNETIQIKGSVTESELKKLYASCKMAVIPLRYGAGVKGKTVEALYHGLPFVSTDFGVEGLPGDHSFLHSANDAASFAASIIALYHNESRLTELSRAGAAYVNSYFTLDAAAVKMRQLLNLTSSQ